MSFTELQFVLRDLLLGEVSYLLTFFKRYFIEHWLFLEAHVMQQTASQSNADPMWNWLCNPMGKCVMAEGGILRLSSSWRFREGEWRMVVRERSPSDREGESKLYSNICFKSAISEAKPLSCVQLCDRMGYSLPGSFVHRIFQARVLKWVAISFFRGSS